MGAINLDNISIDFKKTLYFEYSEKLKIAKNNLEEAQRIVMKHQRNVRDYEEFINALYPDVSKHLFDSESYPFKGSRDPVLFQNDDSEEYNKNWTWKEKALYIIRNPYKYNKKTITGTNDVIDAIIQEEPDRERETETLKNSIAPTISRLIGVEVKKYRSKENYNDIHLIPDEWLTSSDNRIIAILDNIEEIPSYAPENVLSNDLSSSSSYPPKEERTWEEYVMFIFRKMGGRGKASDVSEQAIKANPEIDPKTIKITVKSKLSDFYRRNEIGAIKGKTLTEGYEYFLFDNNKENNINDNEKR